jgi:hypothetical protein
MKESSVRSTMCMAKTMDTITFTGMVVHHELPLSWGRLQEINVLMSVKVCLLHVQVGIRLATTARGVTGSVSCKRRRRRVLTVGCR